MLRLLVMIGVIGQYQNFLWLRWLAQAWNLHKAKGYMEETITLACIDNEHTYDKCIVNSSWAPTFYKFGTGLSLLYKLPKSFHSYSSFYLPEKQHGEESMMGSLDVHTTATFCFVLLFILQPRSFQSKPVICSVFYNKNIWNFISVISLSFFETVKQSVSRRNKYSN